MHEREDVFHQRKVEYALPHEVKKLLYKPIKPLSYIYINTGVLKYHEPEEIETGAQCMNSLKSKYL
jgi:hypothetical protein